MRESGDHRPTNVLAMVAALSLVGSGGCDILKPGPGSSGGASSASSAAPPSPTKVLIGPGNDAEPLSWTTAEASLKAKPPWPPEPSDNEKAVRASYAPQLDEPTSGALFAASEGDAGAGPFLLVCKVEYSGLCDSGVFKVLSDSQRPELDVEMVVGQKSTLFAMGPDDTRKIMVSIPLVSLDAADKISFHLYDRDGGPRDDLGTVTLTMKSLKTKGSGDPSIECRRVGREAVLAQLGRELVEADKSFDQQADPVAQPRDDTLGRQGLEDGLRYRLRRLAALVGWADPRVVRRVEWASRIEARMRVATARLINEEADRRPRRAHFRHARSEYKAELAGIACGPEQIAPYASRIKSIFSFDKIEVGCVLRIATENVGNDTLFGSETFSSSWQAVVGRSDGRSWKATPLDIEGPEATVNENSSARTLKPGARGTVILGVSADVQPGGAGAPRPRLVVLNPYMDMGDGPISLSLDAPADRHAPDGG